ncbi:hypothetical protein NUW58_g4308 [Xylaria curta]|uniref:Uncharacterized protein n=1 Tax=Xylaria curta TaxID=42375 RepID=A0ACC1P847_9PEZI|nr:hypothetical protein NUW58_g4308 [Xylaria curta]
MRTHVFEPLGMASTSFNAESIPASSSRRLAFAVSENGVLRRGVSPRDQNPNRAPGSDSDNDRIEAGGSGLFSTPGDFARLLHGVLAHKVLRPQTTDLLFAPQLDPGSDCDLALLGSGAACLSHVSVGFRWLSRSRFASMDWSCGGFGTLMNKGDSGGIVCNCVLGVDEKSLVRAGVVHDDVAALVVMLRGRRAARGSREAMVMVVCLQARCGRRGELHEFRLGIDVQKCLGIEFSFVSSSTDCLVADANVD